MEKKLKKKVKEKTLSKEKVGLKFATIDNRTSILRIFMIKNDHVRS